MQRLVARNGKEGMIEKRKNYCHGMAVFKGTKIPIYEVIKLKKIGVCDRDILERFTILSAENIVESMEYYKKNSREIELDIIGGK